MILETSDIIYTGLSHQPEHGTITVTLHECVGLSVPAKHTQDLATRQHESRHEQAIAAPSSTRTVPFHPGCGQSLLPYAILCVDKSQAVVWPVSGNTECPVWAGNTSPWHFHASNSAKLRMYLYLKNTNIDGSRQDISLGRVAHVLDRMLDGPRSTEWLDVQEGTGKIRIGLEYKKYQSSTIGPLERTMRSSGLPTGLHPVRKLDTLQLFHMNKVSSADIISSPALPRNLRYEVSNSYIASLQFATRSPTSVYLFSPLINGGYLYHYLQQDQRFGISRSRLYAAELVCAMDHLHDLGLLLPALRPMDYLLDSHGHVTICHVDLLLANPENDNRAAHHSVECPAPEILEGQVPSKSTDSWALGVVLHSLITGMPPFYHEDADEMHRRILYNPLQLPESLPGVTRDLLKLLLDRDPRHRLGANGAHEIKSHAFFQEIDMLRVVRQEYEPAFKPNHCGPGFRWRPKPPPLPFSEIQKQFEGIVWNRPPGRVNLYEVPIPNRDDGSHRNTRETAARTSLLQPTTEPCQSPSPPHQILEGDKGWVLTWKKRTREFYLSHPSKGAELPVEARRPYPDPGRRASDVGGSSITSHVCLELHAPDEPSQSQREDVLEVALAAGNTDVVRQLLEGFGMNLSIQVLRCWQTPLEWAAEQEDQQLVSLLLCSGADPGFGFGDGQVRGSALRKAVEKKNLELAKTMLRNTSRVCATRALGRAVDQQHASMVVLLLTGSVKCDFEASDRPSPKNPESVSFFTCDISYPDEFVPPLVRAVKLGNLEIALLLLTNGANANVGYHDLPPDIDQDYEMVCGRVVQLAMELGNQEMVQLLLAFGCDISLQQPVWQLHECRMIAREFYLKMNAHLRSLVEGAACPC